MHLAPSALDLVLRSERELDGGLCSLVHGRIVVTLVVAPQDLTSAGFSGTYGRARYRSATVHSQSGSPVHGPSPRSSSRSASRRSSSSCTTPSISTRPSSSSPALGVIPLARLIGEATEHLAEHTGPGIGGFLNATFGNAPELIIALIAVSEGLTEVVRGSLTGSVIGNLLLVLGFSLFSAARRDRPPVELHRARARGCDHADPADPIGPGLGR